MKFEVYTDGSCKKNPGPGGFSFIILCGSNEFLRIKGHEDNTTNNRMELKAIVRAIKHIIKSNVRDSNGQITRKTAAEITIYSDSAYCVNPINQGWIHTWKANGWKTKNGEEVKNKDLWEELYGYISYKYFNIKMVKVKGHSGDKYNELVDKAAKEAAEMAIRN